ncbi:MAG: lipase family protein [Sphingomonas sp.]
MPTPIPYDPSNQALYRPEAQPPLVMDDEWGVDAIAAEFSRLAYRRFEVDADEKRQIDGAIETIGYRSTGWFQEAAGTTGFSAKGFAAANDDGQAIIAFRGTQADSFRDLITDATFILENWDRPGRVHSGFSAALSSILAPIESWLRDTNPSRLLLTGHSLGGALATVLAARLVDGDRPIELVTFGSPRVGDEALVASLGSLAVRRYVNCTDAVALLPPPLIYSHVRGLHYIDRDGRIHVGDEPAIAVSKDQRAAHRAYAPLMWRSGNVLWRALADHAPINYVSALLGAREGPASSEA